MRTPYFLKYFKSIQKGLLGSMYFTDQKEVNPELFFETIKKLLLNLKQDKRIIYFLGNGASSAFANHMALDFSKNGKIYLDHYVIVHY